MNLAGRLGEMVSEQIEYRELLVQMTLRDLLLRYKQTVMGFGWAVFMPLVNTVVFSVIFMRVTQIDTPVPYPLFAYCGFLVWNFFASSLRFSVHVADQQREPGSEGVFPTRDLPVLCGAGLPGGLPGRIGGARALMVYYGYSVTPALLFLPVVIAVDHRVHGRRRAAAGDEQPLLSRCQVPVRSRPHGLDVRDLGRVSRRERWRAAWDRCWPSTR